MRLLIIFLILNLSVSANEILVKRVFENSAKEVSELLNFTPSYTLRVTTEDLIDNRGSLVDAIGIPGSITLNQEAWMNFYRQGTDTRLLVLHELMRAQGINDDAFVHSLPLYDSLVANEDFSKRREKSPYCLLKVSEYNFKEKTKKIKVVGESQPMTGGFFSFPNPFAKEAGENAMRKGQEECLSRGYERFVFQNGYTKMESRTHNFSTKNITEAHYKGVCIKKVSQKRRSREVREESCQKANLCLETLRVFPENIEKNRILLEAEKQIQESCR